MENIKLQIQNGNWQDAVRLCSHNSGYFTAIMQSIIDDESMGSVDAMRLLRAAIHFGFIQEHYDYGR